jgi:putative DNA primase/helicase
MNCGYDVSLAIGEEGRLLAHCFGGCDFSDIEAELVQYGLYDNDGSELPHYVPVAAPPSPEELQRRIEPARWIYDHIDSASGTIVEAYFRSRAITLPIPVSIRFAARCPHRLGVMPPAMVAPVVDVKGEQTGIHCTYIKPDGSGLYFDKPVDRKDQDYRRECRGVIRGGTIRLADHDPNCELIVGEGVESVLSAMQLYHLPGWTSVCAGGLATLELPAQVRSVLIAADNDKSGTGQRNAAIAYKRWKAEGRSVRVKIPPKDDPDIDVDFNDYLQARNR